MKNSEREIMLITQEECAEVTQAISKVFRFGFESEYNGRTNKERLEEEIGDLMCMIQLMHERGLIDAGKTVDAAENKRTKLQTWSNINATD